MTEKHAKGPWTPYGPKHTPNKSVSLTLFAKEILAATAERCGISEANVVEHLLRVYAVELAPEQFSRELESVGA